MSRFGPIRCYECGTPMDDKYELFSYLRSLMILSKENEKKSASKNITNIQNTHIDKIMIDIDYKLEIYPIYETLNIRKTCCNQHFLSITLPKDLESKAYNMF